jgi:hypothetical protein
MLNRPIVMIAQALADQGLSRAEIETAFTEFDRAPPVEWLEAVAIVQKTLDVVRSYP